MSAQELFNKLTSSRILEDAGILHFELAKIKVEIRDRSVYGNVIQEWLETFMETTDVSFRKHNSTQEPPDFYMSGDDKQHLLEVKCFTKSPNFDIANFLAYCQLLQEKPWHLDSDYLIFEYSSDEGSLRIKKIWLKKVWEICGSSERSAIKCQWKNNVVYNIRPITWYSKSKSAEQPFQNWEQMLEALSKVLKNHQSAAGMSKNWLNEVRNGFKKYLEETPSSS